MMLMRKDLLGNIFRKLPKSIRLARTVIKCIKSKIIWNRPVDIKTLLLWAENDEYLFWPDAEKLITYFPNATVKKLNEYHDWPVFKPDLLLQHIKDFINT